VQIHALRRSMQQHLLCLRLVRCDERVDLEEVEVTLVIVHCCIEHEAVGTLRTACRFRFISPGPT